MLSPNRRLVTHLADQRCIDVDAIAFGVVQSPRF